MSAYSEFFLNSSKAVVQLQLLEISHPNFSQTFRLVRNARAGITVTHEDATTRVYQYVPMKITQSSSRDDLDTGINVQFGDLGEILPRELDAIAASNGYNTPPTVKYRVYRSDDLTQPLYGPLTLQLRNVSLDELGSAFDAKAPRLNFTRSGLLYTFNAFPMLRGFT